MLVIVYAMNTEQKDSKKIGDTSVSSNKSDQARSEKSKSSKSSTSSKSAKQQELIKDLYYAKYIDNVNQVFYKKTNTLIKDFNQIDMGEIQSALVTKLLEENEISKEKVIDKKAIKARKEFEKSIQESYKTKVHNLLTLVRAAKITLLEKENISVKEMKAATKAINNEFDKKLKEVANRIKQYNSAIKKGVHPKKFYKADDTMLQDPTMMQINPNDLEEEKDTFANIVINQIISFIGIHHDLNAQKIGEYLSSGKLKCFQSAVAFAEALSKFVFDDNILLQSDPGYKKFIKNLSDGSIQSRNKTFQEKEIIKLITQSLTEISLEKTQLETLFSNNNKENAIMFVSIVVLIIRTMIFTKGSEFDFVLKVLAETFQDAAEYLESINENMQGILNPQFTGNDGNVQRTLKNNEEHANLIITMLGVLHKAGLATTEADLIKTHLSKVVKLFGNTISSTDLANFLKHRQLSELSEILTKTPDSASYYQVITAIMLPVILQRYVRDFQEKVDGIVFNSVQTSLITELPNEFFSIYGSTIFSPLVQNLFGLVTDLCRTVFNLPKESTKKIAFEISNNPIDDLYNILYTLHESCQNRLPAALDLITGKSRHSSYIFEIYNQSKKNNQSNKNSQILPTEKDCDKIPKISQIFSDIASKFFYASPEDFKYMVEKEFANFTKDEANLTIDNMKEKFEKAPLSTAIAYDLFNIKSDDKKKDVVKSDDKKKDVIQEVLKSVVMKSNANKEIIIEENKGKIKVYATEELNSSIETPKLHDDAVDREIIWSSASKLQKEGAIQLKANIIMDVDKNLVKLALYNKNTKTEGINYNKLASLIISQNKENYTQNIEITHKLKMLLKEYIEPKLRTFSSEKLNSREEWIYDIAFLNDFLELISKETKKNWNRIIKEETIGIFKEFQKSRQIESIHLQQFYQIIHQEIEKIFDKKISDKTIFNKKDPLPLWLIEYISYCQKSEDNNLGLTFHTASIKPALVAAFNLLTDIINKIDSIQGIEKNIKTYDMFEDERQSFIQACVELAKIVMNKQWKTLNKFLKQLEHSYLDNMINTAKKLARIDGIYRTQKMTKVQFCTPDNIAIFIDNMMECYQGIEKEKTKADISKQLASLNDNQEQNNILSQYFSKDDINKGITIKNIVSLASKEDSFKAFTNLTNDLFKSTNPEPLNSYCKKYAHGSFEAKKQSFLEESQSESNLSQDSLNEFNNQSQLSKSKSSVISNSSGILGSKAPMKK